MADPISSRFDEAVGRQIDRYAVRRCLGTGAFGAVYHAWDPKREREVAAEVLRPNPQDENPEDTRARFLREAKVAAKEAA